MDILFYFSTSKVLLVEAFCMRYLPVVTVLVWMAMVLGYLFSPGFLLLPQVKFPLLILLGILVPVCFWTLQKTGRRGWSLLFLAIFICNIGVPAYGLWRNSTLKASLAEYAPAGIDPQMARLLVAGDTGEERRMAAQILYEKFGVQLPFKGEQEEYSLFNPDKTNRDKYVLNHDRSYRARTMIDNLAYQQTSILVVILLQLVLFLGLLVFLVIYDQAPATSTES